MKRLLNSKVFAILLVLTVLASTSIVAPIAYGAAAAGTSYYVDSINGNDGDSGTDQAHPWQTLDKVNSTTFQPGDKILFHTGGSWQAQLHPLGSGTAENPIVIDMYGDGSAKPAFDAGPVLTNPSTDASNYTSTVRLVDQEYWEINNLDVTNSGTSGYDRRGVSVESTGGTYNHIYIKNLYIHDVKGRLGSASGRKRTGGIIIVGEKATDYLPTARYNDILVEGNSIVDCDNVGMNICENTGINLDTNLSNVDTGAATANDSTNVVIRNNVIDHPGGDGIIVNMSYAPLVEHNVCINANARGPAYACAIWPWDCDKAIFQYNEAYGTRMAPGANGDATAWDSDAFNVGTIYQYNYSHDNDGGSIMICGNAATQDVQGGSGYSDTTYFRYNISQNDHGTIVRLQGPNLDTYTYNNTFYIGPSVSGAKIYWSSNNRGNYSYNNIFYNDGTGSSFSLGKSTNNIFDYNVYYEKQPISNIPNDAHALTSDPKLVAPGTGSTGSDSVDGYKLAADSPCIDTGMAIADNGGKDYFGNAVPAGGATDRGAYEAVNLVAPSGLAAASAAASGTQIVVTWNPVPGTTSYDLEIDGTAHSGITSASYTHTGLTDGSTHTYRVRAVTGIGTTNWSALVSATTPAHTPTYTPTYTPTPSPAPSTNDPVISVLQDGTKVLTVKPADSGSVAGKKREVKLSSGLISDELAKDVDKIVADTGIGMISIPMDVIASISGKDIKVSVEKLDAGSLPDNIKSVAGSNPVYDFNLFAGDTKVTSFGKAIEITLPYVMGTNEDVDRLTVFYINDNGELENAAGVYDAATHTMKFVTTHFSKYMVKENPVSFADIGSTAWASRSIESMAAKGIISGIGGGKFDPSSNVTRAQFAAMIVKALKLTDASAENKFKDVSKDNWYYNAVMTAYKAGIISGRTSDTFAPNADITRQEMAVMLAKAMQLVKGKALPASTGSYLSGFSDNVKIADAYRGDVALVSEYKVISGMPDGTFSPDSLATRAQAATVIYKLFNLD